MQLDLIHVQHRKWRQINEAIVSNSESEGSFRRDHLNQKKIIYKFKHTEQITYLNCYIYWSKAYEELHPLISTLEATISNAFQGYEENTTIIVFHRAYPSETKEII